MKKKVSAIRSFFKFLLKRHLIDQNPASGLRSPKIAKSLMVRDQALLETLYGTGVRVALDRDEDGVFNRDEVLASTNPANPGSVSGACDDGIDNDGDSLTDFGGDTDCEGFDDNNERGCSIIAAGVPGSGSGLAWRSRSVANEDVCAQSRPNPRPKRRVFPD
jgi:hypothetical protein